MASYPRLGELARGATASNSETIFRNRVIPYLIDVWLADYQPAGDGSEIVETTVDTFSYLFDIPPGRLIAAWGLSRGRHGAARDKSRMAGHPLSAGNSYHRGHAIPHTLGGPTDINLVAQRGSINVGPFRAMSRPLLKLSGGVHPAHATALSGTVPSAFTWCLCSAAVSLGMAV
jgi:hypothetical protein